MCSGDSAQVKEARKRILVMEYIQGGRVDDLVYLSENNIDRNTVALELARIFSQMVHINGWFHAVSFRALTCCAPLIGSAVPLRRTHIQVRAFSAAVGCARPVSLTSRAPQETC